MPPSQTAFLDQHEHNHPTNELRLTSAQQSVRAGDGESFDVATTGRHLTVDIAADLRNKTWMGLAKCKTMEPEQFFPHDANGVREAQQICAICPVKLACLAYALDNQLNDGVWGGTSEQERQGC